MIVYNNGYRWKDVCLWEKRLHTPYDYERNGLLKLLLSPAITSSKNPVLKMMTYYIEKSVVLLMKGTDVLRNFKNPNWRNR